MYPDGLSSLLQDAKTILEKDVIHPDLASLPPAKVFESRCTLLLDAFQKSAELRFFEAVYILMYPLFLWFAQKRIIETGMNILAQSLVERLMANLCEHALKPGTLFRSDNLLAWCYCHMENLVQFERAGTRDKETDRIIGISENSCTFSPSEMEIWIWLNNLSEMDRVELKIAESIISNEADLLPRERQALLLYYKNGFSINQTATGMGLNLDDTRHLLASSRSKVLDLLSIKEWVHLWRENIEETNNDQT